MNIDRRDRAKLRQSSPCNDQWPKLNSDPNPNSDISSSYSTRLPPFTYTFPSLLSPSLNYFSLPTSVSSCEVKTSMGYPHDLSSSVGGDVTK